MTPIFISLVAAVSPSQKALERAGCVVKVVPVEGHDPYANVTLPAGWQYTDLPLTHVAQESPGYVRKIFPVVDSDSRLVARVTRFSNIVGGFHTIELVGRDKTARKPRILRFGVRR